MTTYINTKTKHHKYINNKSKKKNNNKKKINKICNICMHLLPCINNNSFSSSSIVSQFQINIRLSADALANIEPDLLCKCGDQDTWKISSV
jgi:hypothetical protein